MMPSEDKHWTDYLALVVAAIALVGGLYSAYLTRLHNRLSVVPHLVVEEYGPNINYNEKTNPDFYLYVENKGIGPAVIENIEYLSDKVNSNDILEISRSLGLNKYGYVVLSLHRFPTYLSPGDELKFIHLDSKYVNTLEPAERARQLNSIGNVVKDIKINVHYRSLYNDKYEAKWPHVR